MTCVAFDAGSAQDRGVLPAWGQGSSGALSCSWNSGCGTVRTSALKCRCVCLCVCVCVREREREASFQSAFRSVIGATCRKRVQLQQSEGTSCFRKNEHRSKGAAKWFERGSAGLATVCFTSRPGSIVPGSHSHCTSYRCPNRWPGHASAVHFTHRFRPNRHYRRAPRTSRP